MARLLARQPVFPRLMSPERARWAFSSHFQMWPHGQEGHLHHTRSCPCPRGEALLFHKRSARELRGKTFNNHDISTFLIRSLRPVPLNVSSRDKIRSLYRRDISTCPCARTVLSADPTALPLSQGPGTQRKACAPRGWRSEPPPGYAGPEGYTVWEPPL